MFHCLTGGHRLASGGSPRGSSVAQRVSRASGRHVSTKKIGFRSTSAGDRHSSNLPGHGRSRVLADTGLNIIKPGVRKTVSFYASAHR